MESPLITLDFPREREPKMESEKPGGGGKGWAMPARRCDACRSAAANLFCRSDSAFFCLSCDAKLHAADKFGFRHERVWMCDVCEQSPASVTCKADAAALCVTCDADIHTANPLARRHERFPVVPFYASAPAGVKPRAELDQDDNVDGEDPETCQEDAEAAAWLLPIPGPKLAETLNLKPGDYFFSDVDPFLDLDCGPPGNGRLEFQINPGRDSVVPVQTTPFPPATVIGLGSDNNCFDPDYTRPKPSYSYTTPSSLSHSVSSSSMDFGVVPDEADITCGGTASSAPVAQQLSALDREARVLRYREKRKKRKFEKTIRYASRKAYAETRPRIKGRFAKRLSSSSDVETEVDRMYSSAASAFMAEGYGVVPSF